MRGKCVDSWGGGVHRGIPDPFFLAVSFSVCFRLRILSVVARFSLSFFLLEVFPFHSLLSIFLASVFSLFRAFHFDDAWVFSLHLSLFPFHNFFFLFPWFFLSSQILILTFFLVFDSSAFDLTFFLFSFPSDFLVFVLPFILFFLVSCLGAIFIFFFFF